MFVCPAHRGAAILTDLSADLLDLIASHLEELCSFVAYAFASLKTKAAGKVWILKPGSGKSPG